MWKNVYEDYPPDEKWQHFDVGSGDGITGCEMHEINGWQNTHHCPLKQKGFFSKLKERWTHF